jgi:hypothetical protein
MYFDARTWTPEMEEHARQLQKEYNILTNADRREFTVRNIRCDAPRCQAAPAVPSLKTALWNSSVSSGGTSRRVLLGAAAVHTVGRGSDL